MPQLEAGRNRIEIRITTDGSCFSNVSLVYILLKRSTDDTKAADANKCALVNYDIFVKAAKAADKDAKGEPAFNSDTNWAAATGDDAKTHCTAGGETKFACACDAKGADAKADKGMFFDIFESPK